MGVELRDLGTTAQFAPIMKRATARLSTGQSVIVVPDTNRSDSNGDDVTGTAKIFIYLSTDAERTAFTLTRTHTTGVAFASSTKAAVMSVTVREDDRLYICYQGTDNSLRFIEFNFTAGAYAAGSEQTVVAANAVTDRFRALDIDASPTNANPAIIGYEAAASTGQGADIRVWVRMNDGTTWTRAYTEQIFTTQFIRAGGEDVSIAWNKIGIASNVGQMALYYSKTFSTGDNGDTVREISFNVNAGATDSATVVGSWYTAAHQNIASGTRRGWLFSEANDRWMLAQSVGSAVPFFAATRLQHNVFTGMTVNKTSGQINFYRDVFLFILNDFNVRTAVAVDYTDSRVVFAFTGLGVLTSRITRSVVIRFSSTVTDPVAVAIDTNARPLDNGFSYQDGVISVYGGANKNTLSANAYNFAIMYGKNGNTVSGTPGVSSRKMYAVREDVLSIPTVLSPADSIVSNDNPTLQASMQNLNVYSAVLGKVHFQLATNPGFTLNVVNAIQDDSAFLSYSATSSSVPPTRVVSHTLTSGQSLFSGVWYIRAKILDDLGGESSWSDTETFIVSHPPTALPTSPTGDQTFLYGTGDVVFTWNFSDTEPTDTQSAYQITVIRTDTGAIAFDSGKVVSSSRAVTQNFASGLKDIPLKWYVTLWDSDDVQGPASAQNVFTLADPPTVTITSPTAGGTVTTAIPTVTWSFSVGGVRTQRAYRVLVYHTDPTPDESVGDSGWVFSAATSYTFSANILENLQNYRVEVYVIDSVGLEDSDNLIFDADWVEPALGDVSLTSDQFKVTVAWTDANVDADWVAWRVYRRYQRTASSVLDVTSSATTWVLIHETTDVDTDYEYRDYFAPLNKSIDYVVVQLVDRFGSLIESDITAFSSITVVGNRYYFVPEIPIGVIASFEAAFVTADSFLKEVEQETLHVIGRGRQVQIGDDLGYTGTLSIKLRNPSSARADREFIEYLSSDDTGNVYIRSPFGDVLYVAFGNVSTSRIAGTGTSDLVDLNVPYSEVFAEAPITRTGS